MDKFSTPEIANTTKAPKGTRLVYAFIKRVPDGASSQELRAAFPEMDPTHLKRILLNLRSATRIVQTGNRKTTRYVRYDHENATHAAFVLATIATV
jgi:hypothetical protein